MAQLKFEPYDWFNALINHTSPREFHISYLRLTGEPTAHIAQQLGIKTRTVTNAIGSFRGKFEPLLEQTHHQLAFNLTDLQKFLLVQHLKNVLEDDA
jgi:hypothetical protein